MEQANAEVGRKDVNSALPTALWSRYCVMQCNAL